MSDQQTITGDSDELQDLFDLVAKGMEEPTVPSDQLPQGQHQEAEDLHTQIGHMTRKLHDTLRSLGYDKALERAAESIPDARERLSYIAAMTEKAATRTLTAIENARPKQDSLALQAKELGGQWDALFSNQLGIDGFKTLAEKTRSFLNEVPEKCAATNAQLMEIMMAQDFQDLTGQVIKKVTELAQDLEAELLNILVASTPLEKREKHDKTLLNGPAMSSSNDVLHNQGQVDELLESLGF
ncbi:MAG: protein phosphatase CheZ [Proteobacteria bacterium]|nr:protein phosphatase CheZ [Pseudomonadota bacterium]